MPPNPPDTQNLVEITATVTRITQQSSQQFTRVLNSFIALKMPEKWGEWPHFRTTRHTLFLGLHGQYLDDDTNDSLDSLGAPLLDLHADTMQS